MSSQVPFLSKCLTADVTLKWPLRRVGQRVSSQTAQLCECSGTYAAHVRFLACVGALVRLEAAAAGELFPAGVALEGLLVRVRALMHSQVLGAGEGLATDTTDKLLLVGMDTLMGGKAAGVSEQFAAGVTVVRFFFGVRPDVPL